MTKHLSTAIFHKYTAKTGGICWEGLEDHHIQTRPCNSIEKEQPFCFHLSKSKQRRMQTCWLSQIPWRTFKCPEESKRWCSQWKWVDPVLSSWATQSTVMCWCMVVYQRLRGRSPVGRTCHGLCFLWEDVYYGGYIMEDISWGFVFVLCTGLLWFVMGEFTSPC